MKPSGITEARATIKEYPDQDEFVCRNNQGNLSDGEYNDNSIELASYWNLCKKMVDQSDQSLRDVLEELYNCNLEMRKDDGVGSVRMQSAMNKVKSLLAANQSNQINE